MKTKTIGLMFFAAGFSAIASGIVASSGLMSRELAQALSTQAALTVVVFILSPTWKQGFVIAALTLLWGAGVFYVFNVRRDAIGFAALVACGVLAYLIIRPYRRELLQAKG